MKIFKIAMICVSMMALISTASHAASMATTVGGTPLVIPANATLGIPALDFTPSPSTIMAVESTPLAFAATAGSTKTTTENGIMYGTLSSRSPMYQLVQAADGKLVPPVSAASLGATWKDKSNNTAP